jgi:hypothetical protein
LVMHEPHSAGLPGLAAHCGHSTNSHILGSWRPSRFPLTPLERNFACFDWVAPFCDVMPLPRLPHLRKVGNNPVAQRI